MRQFQILLMLLALLAGCAAQPPSRGAPPILQSTAAPNTPIASSPGDPTATLTPPTQPAGRTPTPASQPRPAPTLTPSPLPSPLPLPESGDWQLSPQTAAHIEKLYELKLAPLGKIWALAWSPNAELLAAAGESGLALFDGATLKLRRELPTSAAFTSLAFSADGRRLAAGGYASIAQVWDVAEGRLLLTLTGAGYRVALSPDGLNLAAVHEFEDYQPDGTPLPVQTVLNLYRVETGKLLYSSQSPNPVSIWNSEPLETLGLYFSPDGQRIQTANNYGDVKLWDAASGRMLSTSVNHNTRARLSSGFCAASGASGAPSFGLACYLSMIPCTEDDPGCTGASLQRYEIGLWDTTQIRRMRNLTVNDPPGQFRALLYDPQTPQFGLLDISGRLEFRPVASPAAPAQTLTSPLASAWAQSLKDCWMCAPPAIALQPGSASARLAIAYQGQLELWDIAQQRLLASYANPTVLITSAALGEDSAQLSLALGYSDGKIAWLRPADGSQQRAIQAHDGPVSQLAFAGPELLLSSAEDGLLRAWPAGQSTPAFEYAIQPFYSAAGASHRFALSPSGAAIAANQTGGDGADTLTVRGLPGGDIAFALTYSVRQARFSQDGRWLAEARDETVILWDAQSGQPIRRFPAFEGRVHDLALSPDGGLLAAAQASSLRLWDVNSAETLLQLELAGASAARVAFSPTGCLLASADSLGRIRLTDIAARRTLSEWWAHAGRVETLAFSADGRILLSVGKDGAVRLWGQPGALALPPGQARPLCRAPAPPQTSTPQTPSPTAAPRAPTATPTLLAFYRALSLTDPPMRGDDVLQMQERLAALGYTGLGIPDGIFGPRTDQAVRLFQQRNGLVVDGVVGPITWQRLFSPAAVRR